MMRVDSSPVVRCAALLLCMAACDFSAGQTIVGPRTADVPPVQGPPPAQLATLQPVLRQFDFEEAERFNLAFPEHFYRLNAPDQGFPPFGRMGFSSAQAASGSWSFEFALAGGSMSARIPAGVLPVLPHADYLVTAKVRTHGLLHGRARIGAWLLDGNGQPIDTSRGQSRLVISEDRWDMAWVEVHGDSPGAAHLVLELQVLQPRQFESTPASADVPQIEDITGQVWFDDVVVSHLPRLNLSMAQPGNVVVAPDHPRLTMVLSELSNEQLTASLRVFDLDGRMMHESTFPAPRGRQHASVDLPIARCGWYRAVLDILSRDRLARRQMLDFVIIPPDDHRSFTRSTAAPSPSAVQFGIRLPPTPADGLPLLPTLVNHLDVDAALLPVWNADLTLQSAPQHLAALRIAIEQMLRSHVDLTFTLERLPDELARTMALDDIDVFEMLRGDSRTWRQYLDELLVNFGLEVSRWQVGDPRQPMTIPLEQIPDLVDVAERSLADFVPDPAIIVPWPAERAIDPTAPAQPINIWLPHHLTPHGVGELAAGSTHHRQTTNADVIALLDQLPVEQYTNHQRMADLMQRGLYAWRGGVSHVVIDAPWGRDAQHPTQAMPDAAFAIWRTLAHELRDRTFAGELPVADGVHCWFLRGIGRPAALVAWSDQSIGSHMATLRLQMAMGDVTVMDAFGNVEKIAPQGAVHEIPLNEIPVFVTDVALELVQFRGGFSIQPDFVPAAARVHEHTIVLRNPWNMAVSGTIRLVGDEQWQLTPSVQDFVMPAGGEVSLPLSIIPQRSITAGLKTVYADVTLNADRTYELRVQTQVDVGLKNIDLAASWAAAINPQTGQEDLVITNVVSNKGEQVMNLDVYMLAPGVSQNRRTIARLGPGETAVRTFRIPDGMSLLAGKTVRVGVEERDGVARLNRVLEITATDELALQSTANP